MAALIEECATVLDQERLHFLLSHTTLSISTHQEYWTRIRHPFVSIHSDGEFYDFTYQHHWDDGDLMRSYQQRIRCGLTRAEDALTELLNRLS